MTEIYHIPVDGVLVVLSSQTIKSHEVILKPTQRQTTSAPETERLISVSVKAALRLNVEPVFLISTIKISLIRHKLKCIILRLK
jgi:CTP:molybdopterin cytidylyltransferase MocA